MADINLTQVIHNVKEAYVGLTGDTDAITYGNISTKISKIQTGGGGAIGDRDLMGYIDVRISATVEEVA